MQINEEALKLAVKAIEAEPSAWQQTSWARGLVTEIKHNFRGSTVYELADTSCGTRMCLAGHIVSQAGWIPVATDRDVRDAQKFADMGTGASDGSVHTAVCRNPETGEVRQVSDLAREILGISYDQAQSMFDASVGNNNIQEFKQDLAAFTGVTFDKE